MILTQCAVCATELGLSLGKKCGRCSTRYCGPECQKKHWEEGGHDQLCKKIKKAGGAEQYNANKRYTEAVAVAAEKCADDTKGQTCYICTEALHRHTKEGLVRMCACRGTAGFAHVSCLAEEAKILVAGAMENNLDDIQWHRWHTCSLCEQQYYHDVRCALGWACWKTYVGQPEGARRLAMQQLGSGLALAEHYEDALTVQEALLALTRRIGAPEDEILTVQGNLASTYQMLGREEQASQMVRDVYHVTLNLYGEENQTTIGEANSYATSLVILGRFEEAKALLRKTVPMARRVLGESHELTLKMRSLYANALYADDDATLDGLREAVTTLEDTDRIARRVFGGAHPIRAGTEEFLRNARAALAARDTPPTSN